MSFNRAVLLLPQRAQLSTRRNRSVLDIYDLISNSELDDVRWDKVERFKLILTNGAYPVPSAQVAARVIERMLERGRSYLRRSTES